MSALMERFRAIVTIYYTQGRDAWLRARAALEAEIGAEAVQDLANEYDNEYSRACEAKDMDAESDSRLPDGTRFADPGGRSALRAAGRGNPRNRSCPTCKARNVLTPADVARGYQCNRCADRDEGRGDY